MKDTDAIDQERQRRCSELAAEMREALEPRTASEVAAAFVAHMPDVMSFPPLPPSPAEVGDLVLSTREHVQALGWGNREQLYAASQVRALLSECAIMSAAREREKCIKAVEAVPPHRWVDGSDQWGQPCSAKVPATKADYVAVIRGA